MRWALATIALVAVSGAGAGEAARWLERMMDASRSLNYDGTFVYRKGDAMESMRVIHRNDASGERERLITLTGVPREVVRDSTQVICILPDDRSVVVARSRPKGRLRPAVDLLYGAGLSEHYDLSSGEGERVAGRETRAISVMPVDQYRYGYRLWLDEETGLLLRSVLVGEGAETLEEIVYTSISMPEQIPDRLLEPAISRDGFTVRDLTSAGAATPASYPDQGQWAVDWLPPGFQMSERANSPGAGNRMLAEHLVYSDGLATISIFIEGIDAAGDRLDGLSRMGALSAFGVVAGDHQVTVVGEVPPATVKGIAESVRRD